MCKRFYGASKIYTHANCMGFAFHKNAWLFPCYKEENYLDENTAIQYITNKGYHLIKRSEMILGKEYILMRFGDSDFHFVRRNKDGHYFHKPGSHAISTMSKKEALGNSWCEGRYRSKIIIFVKN